jgi:AcrR family transcriptional regulator
MTTIPGGRRHSNSARTAHGEMQRRSLARIAYELIAEGGFERLRTREVAARAGINIATLHYYFPTKEDLVRAVVERLDEEFAATHDPAAGPNSNSPLDELRTDLADGLDQVRVSPQTWVVWFELLMRSLRDPSIRALVQEAEAHWRDHIRSYLTAGVQQGMFRADLDTAAASAGLVAFINGSALQALTDPGTLPADRMLAEIERWLAAGASA